MINKSKLNQSILATLNVSEALLTQTEIIKRIYPQPVTMSHRVTTSVVIKKLLREQLISEPETRLYEITTKGEKQLTSWENS